MKTNTEVKTVLRMAEVIRVSYLRGKAGEDMSETITELRDVGLDIITDEVRSVMLKVKAYLVQVMPEEDYVRFTGQVDRHILAPQKGTL